jgi:hypothetical protein
MKENTKRRTRIIPVDKAFRVEDSNDTLWQLRRLRLGVDQHKRPSRRRKYISFDDTRRHGQLRHDRGGIPSSGMQNRSVAFGAG